MKNLKIKITTILVFTLAYLNVGCSDVSFQPTEFASKASGDQYIGDPDDPRPGEPEDPRPEEPVDPPVDPKPEPTTNEQVFQQNAGGGMLDLLIVVDNSDSMMMDHYDHKVRDMFRGFLASLDGVDYQIGFIVTDMISANDSDFPGWGGRLDNLQGTSNKILKPTTANKQSLFLNTIDREEARDCRDTVREDIPGAPCGTNTEEPLKAIMAFVDKKDRENSGFFRNGADFVSVIITDENERSTGEGPLTTQPSQVVNHVQSSFGGLKSFTNYSVVIKPGDSACKRKQECSEFLCIGGGNYGRNAAFLSSLTSGKTASICDSDVSDDFKDIGDRSRNGGLFDEVTLEHMPVEGSVQVFFNPVTDISYSVEGQTVKFNSKPSAGTEVKVIYEHF